jgi:hypothetical protein
MRIMLQRRQRLNQPGTAFMNEQRRRDASFWLAEPLQYFRPTIHPIRARDPLATPPG